MKPETERIMNNSLTDLVAGVKMSTMLTGGSDLANYGTIAYNNNYSLLTLNRVILTYLYAGSGIIQRAIQVPVLDAMSRGIKVESGELSGTDIDELMDHMESTGQWEALKDAFTWARLYGGAGIVINSNQEPREPLSLRRLKNSPLEMYDLDRWQFDNSHPYAGDFEDYFMSGGSNDQYFVYGMPIHESRIIRIRNKRAPYYVRRQLRGWGMSEAERMIPPLNLYLKTQNVLYEILDESKIDVFRLKGFNDKLIQKGGTETITQRLQLANELKSYVNALVMDQNDDYEQKQISFGGLAEVSSENRIGIAAAITMPVTKLFGLSASGFNTGESDLENYNAMVEADVRTPMRPTIRRMLEVNMANLWGYVPTFQFHFPSLRVLSAGEEEEVKTSQTHRHLALYDRGLIDSQEFGQAMRQDSVLAIETRMEKGQVPDPDPPAGPESIDQFHGGAVANSNKRVSQKDRKLPFGRNRKK